jgi:hypothetical protein
MTWGAVLHIPDALSIFWWIVEMLAVRDISCFTSLHRIFPLNVPNAYATTFQDNYRKTEPPKSTRKTQWQCTRHTYTLTSLGWSQSKFRSRRSKIITAAKASVGYWEQG